MRDRFTGEARGFGFVEINDDTAANRAIEACNGRDLMGRALVVNEARPMVPREGGGGGRGPAAAVDASAAAAGPAASTGIYPSSIFAIASASFGTTTGRLPSLASIVRPSGSCSSPV